MCVLSAASVFGWHLTKASRGPTPKSVMVVLTLLVNLDFSRAMRLTDIREFKKSRIRAAKTSICGHSALLRGHQPQYMRLAGTAIWRNQVPGRTRSFLTVGRLELSAIMASRQAGCRDIRFQRQSESVMEQDSMGVNKVYCRRAYYAARW